MMVDVKSEKTVPARVLGTVAGQTARAYAKAIAEAVAPYGLAPAAFAVLREVWRAEGLTQSALALRLRVEQATMANTLKRMERDGLILRKAHPADARAQGVYVTEKAREIEKPAKAAVKRVHARAARLLGGKDRKRFVDLSRRIVAGLAGNADAPT